MNEKIEKIIKRDGRLVPFAKEKIVFAIYRAAVAVGGRDRKIAESVADEVVAMLLRRNYANSYPTVEEVQDIVEKCLIEKGHAKTAKAYIIYRYEHELKRKGKTSLTYTSENIPYRTLWEALSWAVDQNCARTCDLQNLIDTGHLEDLIKASEEFYENQLANAFNKIKERLADIKILIIAGPSASGKTTTTKKLAMLLKEYGKQLIALEIDNYFFDLEFHPKDSHGDYDFETPQALDLALINKHLKNLLEGKTVQVPQYDFKKGKRLETTISLSLPENGIILLDSLHGLYPEMTLGISEEKKFKLYIETLAQLKDNQKQYIRWSDIRLLRRMVRDMQFRNYNAQQTILHWHHVRRSEMRYIISRLQSAQAIVNSWLAYELPFLKSRLYKAIKDFICQFKDKIEFEDAFERATRIYQLFQELPTVDSENLIPLNSLFREFIGGQKL